MEDSNDKLFGVLSYLSILVLIPLIAGKTQFVKFHANQGLVLAIVEVVFSVLIGIFVKIPILGVIFGIVGGLFDLICLIMAIIGIVGVVNGETKELPVIGAIKLVK
ncbi:MAG: hypothetical protein K2J80_11950 [Oscillospiraceae bacterium]|nr:hypothetical protein [Oscillospiraceae bacterium]